MTQAEMMKLGMALGICLAAVKFGPHPLVKAAGVGVAAVIVAKRVPVLKDALA
ncbi:MAG: hypothetical protein ACXW2U_00795 [Telluria sp.]